MPEQILGVAQVVVHPLAHGELHRVGLGGERRDPRRSLARSRLRHRTILNRFQNRLRIGRLLAPPANRLHARRDVEPRKTLGQQLLDLRLSPVRRGGDQVGPVFRGEVRREQHHRGQAQAAVRERVENSRAMPCRTGGLDALGRRVLGQVQLADAVGEHGGIGRRQVQLAGVELGDVRHHGGGAASLLGNSRAQIAAQRLVGEVRKRVALHGNLDGGRCRGALGALDF